MPGQRIEKMKEYIFQKIINILDINSIIQFIDSLKKKDKLVFLEELIKKCQFTKEEYYSKNENKKITLLCELNYYWKIKITYEEKLNRDLEEILIQIWKDLKGEILIKSLIEFLENEEIQIIKRLGLINIILQNFEPRTEYFKLKTEIEKIKIDIEELTGIKNSLSIFLRNRFQNEIREISNIIKDIPEKNLKNYCEDEETRKKVSDFKKFKVIADDIKNVKDFLFFKVLYDETSGNDEVKCFEEAKQKLIYFKDSFRKIYDFRGIYEENKELFNKIKEMLSNDESKTYEFIYQMRVYFRIERKQAINELELLFKSKK